MPIAHSPGVLTYFRSSRRLTWSAALIARGAAAGLPTG